MKGRQRWMITIGSMILFLLGACGQKTQPAPVTNPSGVETSLASTAKAFAQQTETALGYTATPSVVPTETLTPTPKISISGSSLIVRDDQSTQFVDYKAGMQLTIPAGWLSVRTNEEEYYRAFTLDVVLAEPALSDRLTIMQNNDPDNFRVTAIDIRPEHVVNGMASDINVILQPEQVKTLSEWAKTDINRSRLFKEYRRISSTFKQTPAGLDVYVLEESWKAVKEGRVYFKRVVFSLPAGMVTVDFQCPLDFKDTILSEFDQVVNSLTLLDQ